MSGPRARTPAGPTPVPVNPAVADQAVAALREEALLASAEALRPTFHAVARAAQRTAAGAGLREELGRLGRAGPGAAVSHGERARRRYGTRGARGEAEGGFPHVVEVALPRLRRDRATGLTEETARLNALLEVMSRLNDTCVLHRGGLGGLRAVRLGAARVLAAGGAGTERGRAALAALDERLTARRLSPGGSGDLLAAALFLDMMPWPPALAGREVVACRR